MRLLLAVGALAGCADSGASIDLAYALPPGVQWVSPAGPTVQSAGQRITFEGWVDDRDTAREDLRVDLTADGRTVCAGLIPDAQGTVLCLGALRETDQELALQVLDPEGREDVATLPVEVVPGTPPILSFQAEHADGPYPLGEPVRLLIVATDAEDGPADLRMSLSSDQDGPLDIAPPDDDGRILAEVDLSQGNHRLVLEVSDTSGLRTTAEIWVQIRLPGTGACTLTAPDDGSVLQAGSELPLGAHAELGPDEGPPIVTWDSNLDGRLAVAVTDGRGDASMSISGLSRGTHILSLQADTDEPCTHTITVVAGAPPTLSLMDLGPLTAGVPTELVGTVTDDENGADDVIVEVFNEDNELIGSAWPEADGNLRVWLQLDAPGARTLRARATDPHDMSVDISVPVDVLAE